MRKVTTLKENDKELMSMQQISLRDFGPWSEVTTKSGLLLPNKHRLVITNSVSGKEIGRAHV